MAGCGGSSLTLSLEDATTLEAVDTLSSSPITIYSAKASPTTSVAPQAALTRSSAPLASAFNTFCAPLWRRVCDEATSHGLCLDASVIPEASLVSSLLQHFSRVTPRDGAGMSSLSEINTSLAAISSCPGIVDAANGGEQDLPPNKWGKKPEGAGMPMVCTAAPTTATTSLPPPGTLLIEKPITRDVVSSSAIDEDLNSNSMNDGTKMTAATSPPATGAVVARDTVPPVSTLNELRNLVDDEVTPFEGGGRVAGQGVDHILSSSLDSSEVLTGGAAPRAITPPVVAASGTAAVGRGLRVEQQPYHSVASNTASQFQSTSDPPIDVATLSLEALLCILERTEDLGTLNFTYFIIYLCSGPLREGSISVYLAGIVAVLCVDPLVHKGADLADSRTRRQLTRLAAHTRCVGVIATPLCRSFSVASFAGGDGPEPSRDQGRPGGIRSQHLHTKGLLPTQIIHDNAIVDACIDIISAACSHGAFGWIENPPGRGAYSEFPMQGRESHAPLWAYPPMAEWIIAAAAVSIIFDQCRVGMAEQKKTQFVVTPNIGTAVRAAFEHLQCNHTHAVRLLGRKADDSFVTSKAENFKPELNKIIAMIVVDFSVGYLTRIHSYADRGEQDVHVLDAAPPLSPSPQGVADLPPAVCMSVDRGVEQEDGLQTVPTSVGAVAPTTTTRPASSESVAASREYTSMLPGSSESGSLEHRPAVPTVDADGSTASFLLLEAESTPLEPNPKSPSAALSADDVSLSKCLAVTQEGESHSPAAERLEDILHADTEHMQPAQTSTQASSIRRYVAADPDASLVRIAAHDLVWSPELGQPRYQRSPDTLPETMRPLWAGLDQATGARRCSVLALTTRPHSFDLSAECGSFGATPLTDMVGSSKATPSVAAALGGPVAYSLHSRESNVQVTLSEVSRSPQCPTSAQRHIVRAEQNMQFGDANVQVSPMTGAAARQARHMSLSALDAVSDEGIIQSRILSYARYSRRRSLMAEFEAAAEATESVLSSASERSDTVVISSDSETDSDSDDGVIPDQIEVTLVNVEGKPTQRFSRLMARVDCVLVYIVENVENPRYAACGHRTTHYLEYKNVKCSPMTLLCELEPEASTMEFHLRRFAVDTPLSTRQPRGAYEGDASEILSLVADHLGHGSDPTDQHAMEGVKDFNMVLHCLNKGACASSSIQTVDDREFMAKLRMERSIAEVVGEGDIFERHAGVVASLAHRLGIEPTPEMQAYHVGYRPTPFDRYYVHREGDHFEPSIRIIINVGEPCAPPRLEGSINFSAERCINASQIFTKFFEPMGIGYVTHCLTGFDGVMIDGQAYRPQSLNGHKLFCRGEQCLFLWLRKREDEEMLGPLFQLPGYPFAARNHSSGDSWTDGPSFTDNRPPRGAWGDDLAGPGGSSGSNPVSDRQARRLRSGASTKRSSASDRQARRRLLDASTTRSSAADTARGKETSSTTTEISHRSLHSWSSEIVLEYREQVQTLLNSPGRAPIPVMSVRRAPSSIDCGDDASMSPLCFKDVHMGRARGGSQRVANVQVLGDTGAGVGLASPSFVQRLRAINPDAVEVVQQGPLVSAVTGVSPDAPHCIVDEIVNIRGLILGDVTVADSHAALPQLEKLSVIRDLPFDMILGNQFNYAMGANYDYSSGCVTLRDSEGHTKRVEFTVEESGDPQALIVKTAQPVAFNPETITVEPRMQQIIRVRVPAHTPVGAEVLMTPLMDTRCDVGIMIQPGLCKVAADGFVPVTVVNPLHRRVVIPLMTPLAHFVLAPDVVMPEPEFTVDEVMASINLGPELTQEDRDLLREMLKTRLAVFASKPGYAHGVQCHIHTPSIDNGSVAPPQAQGQPNWGQREARLKALIEEQVAAGYLARTSSDFNSRPVLVKKAGTDELRLVVDFRALNDLSTGDRYPIPSIQSALNRVGKANWLSCLDLLAGFHQIEISVSDGSAQKTAFQTPWGQYMYVRMPMGLKSAPATFCRIVAAIFQGLPAGVAIDYVDDVATATSGTFADHVRDLAMVFDRLIEAGFTVKMKKIFLGYKEIPWLGFLVGVNGIRPDPLKTQAIRDIKLDALVDSNSLPSRFVGLIQYYSRFIPNFATISAVFYDLKAAKGVEARRLICRSLKAIVSFQLVKKAIEDSVILSRPDWTRSFIVCTDASADGAGAVLAQLDEDDFERPVAFWSHRFDATERAGSVIDREGFGLHGAVRHYRPFLLGADFDVYTDHGSLTYLMTHQHQEGSRRQRWALELQGFGGMKLHHRPGKDMVVPDAISRLFELLHVVSTEASSTRVTAMPNGPLAEPVGEENREGDENGTLNVSQDEAAVFDRVTLTDVPGFLPPRTFMVNSDTLPSTADVSLPVPPELVQLLLELNKGSSISDASLLRASGVETTTNAESQAPKLNENEAAEQSEDTASDASVEQGAPSAPASNSTSQAPGNTVKKQACNPVNAKGRSRVGVVYTDGRSVMVWRQEGSPSFISGLSTQGATRSYRELAIAHFASIVGDHSPTSLNALKNAAYSTKCGDTMYFVAVMSKGEEPLPRRRPLAWIHPDIGRIEPSPEGTLEWIDIELISGSGLKGRSDIEIARRITLASEGHGSAQRLSELLRSARPADAPTTRRPSATSMALSSHVKGTTGQLNPYGPSLHDSSITAHPALRQLERSVGLDPLRVLALDLEGQLRVGGSIEFIQAAASPPFEPPCVQVFDIKVDDSPLTGAGYDGEHTPRSLRSLLEDEAIVKVLHCGVGDCIILFHGYGITVRNVFDTSVGDSVCRGVSALTKRSLAKILATWGEAGAEMQHKEAIVHTPALWSARPLTKQLFEYCFEDVLFLRGCYQAQLHDLSQKGMAELAVDIASHSFPPLSLGPSHALWPTPNKIVILMHDPSVVVCLSDKVGSQPFLPHSMTAPKIEDFEKGRGWNAAAREVWASIAGPPVKGLVGEMYKRYRKPSYVGDALVFELRFDRISPEMLELLDRSLKLYLAANPSAERRCVSLQPLSMQPRTAWEKLCLQYLRHGLRVVATSAEALKDLPTTEPESSTPSQGVPVAVVRGLKIQQELTRVAVLLHDAKLGLFVRSSRTGQTTLPEGPLDAANPLASTLKILETCLGPVLCFPSFPWLSATLLDATDRARVAVAERNATLLVYLDLGEDGLGTARASLARAFVTRRTTATLKAAVTSICYRPLCDSFDDVVTSDIMLSAMKQISTALYPERSKAESSSSRHVMVAWAGTDKRRVRRSAALATVPGLDVASLHRTGFDSLRPLDVSIADPSVVHEPRVESHVTPNWEVDAESHDNTSVNLGLAADSVSQSDYDMASLPLEKVGDDTTVAMDAYRDGQSIGRGLFAARDIAKGETVSCFGRGAYIVSSRWQAYCRERGLEPTWAGFEATRCLPAPTKAMAQVILYDMTWEREKPRAKWSFINHSKDSPNCYVMVPSRKGCDVTWYSLRDIAKGEELTFDYGGDTDGFVEYSQDAGSRQDTKRQRRLRGSQRPPSPPCSPPPVLPQETGVPTWSSLGSCIRTALGVLESWGLSFATDRVALPSGFPEPPPSAPSNEMHDNEESSSPESSDDEDDEEEVSVESNGDSNLNGASPSSSPLSPCEPCYEEEEDMHEVQPEIEESGPRIWC